MTEIWPDKINAMHSKEVRGGIYLVFTLQTVIYHCNSYSCSSSVRAGKVAMKLPSYVARSTLVKSQVLIWFLESFSEAEKIQILVGNGLTK